ncbi:hypothetical protein KBD33_03650 [Candidatus Gracilibacteria bacterium]|nr:hypothetical protein [Candidatus Gracilibacteria bacterium]
MKSNIKDTLVLFLILPLSLLLAGCLQEYDVHYKSENGGSEATVFTVSGENVFVDPGILLLPNKSIRTDLIEYIDHASSRVWIEIYTWTDSHLFEALIRAHKRGVDTRVVLEPSVFGTPTINKKIYDGLVSQGVDVVYADSYRYTFTHAKFMIIDNRYFISTGNFTESFFTKNRDLIFTDTGTGITSFMSSLFEKDYNHLGTNDMKIPDQLVISPINSRDKIESLIKEAKKDIIIYTQTLSDENILTLVKKAQSEGITLEICTAKNESNLEQENKSGLNWKTITKPYVHTKLILVDSERFFIGSQNLTQNSLDNNREVGIIISGNSGLLSKLFSIYEEDCR